MLEAPKPPGSFLSGFLFPMLYTDSLARASRRVVRTAYNVSMPSPLVSTSMGTFIHLLALRATSPILVISCNHHSSAAVSHLISSPLSSPNTDSAAGEQVVCSEEYLPAPSDRVQKFHELIHEMLLAAWSSPSATTMEISAGYSPALTELLKQAFWAKP